MYSGSTMTTFSGRLIGTHQKIDRAAHKQLRALSPQNHLPSIRLILHFEGGNGPAAITRKSPAKDVPWHFFQPYNADDTQLLRSIESHYHSLVAALKAKDEVRAAFEAAWLSHAVVDGLTPAHHYPYEEKLVELMSGKSVHDRASVKEKVIMPGETATKQMQNNWKLWGAKGLFTTHFAFEWGVGTLMLPMKLTKAVPTAAELAEFEALPLQIWFRKVAQGVAGLELYDAFYKSGWTIPLARRVRRQLAPILVRAVTLVWYGAIREAYPEKAV
jgi:hypothetical protein